LAIFDFTSKIKNHTSKIFSLQRPHPIPLRRQPNQALNENIDVQKAVMNREEREGREVNIQICIIFSS
jgi:hypothetical protein